MRDNELHAVIARPHAMAPTHYWSFAGTGALTVMRPDRPDAGRISTTMSCAATFHPMNDGPSSGMDMTVVTFLGIDGAEEIAVPEVAKQSETILQFKCPEINSLHDGQRDQSENRRRRASHGEC